MVTRIEEKQKKKNNKSMDLKDGKYLVFGLAEELYAFDIMNVQEIIGMMEITRLPEMPEYVRGVINLRGKIIPVMDLRLKFGFEYKEYDERTCIIVFEFREGDEDINCGIIVDKVTEVEDIDSTQVEPAPHLEGDFDTEYILGIGKTRKGVVILMDAQSFAIGMDSEALISENNKT